MMELPKGARRGLRFIAPFRRPPLLPFAVVGSWLYVRFGCRVRHEELHGGERLVRAYQAMQGGTARLIVAFRHVGVEDGPAIFRLMTGITGREARRRGMRLSRPPRGYFLYGRDVPEWAGHFLNWLFPRIGAIPVYPGRYDSRSIKLLRHYLTDMPHPVALAPEGQVTYHNERVARLQPGTAQLGFWCMEDLKGQGRSEEVLILPVCTSYHYDPKDWKGLIRLLEKTERECGLAPLDGGRDVAPQRIYERVMRVSTHLVRVVEDFYARFYGVSFTRREGEISLADLQERMRCVCDAALSTAEKLFNLNGKGDFPQRVFASRQTALGRMFREDIEALDELPALDRALADRVALETWLANRHVEMADILEYLRADYLKPDSHFDRFVESITNLWDLVNRLEGGNVSGRINPFHKTARFVVNEPIAVSRYWHSYGENRRRAVASLTAEIYESFRSVAERGAGGDSRANAAPGDVGASL
jgi:hypothetical protein